MWCYFVANSVKTENINALIFIVARYYDNNNALQKIAACCY